ncbi:MAG: hypothetical protein EZS28_028317 [Streblomastix strix]|uniref:Uncharacterized protein n=1 Tax=Streblomastix strix TaxID=222440 RepID=A0A5J4V284_9EUKA|nr:MAG: hypothetical protein EZS28_028317 [Streblomastix strix]
MDQFVKERKELDENYRKRIKEEKQEKEKQEKRAKQSDIEIKKKDEEIENLIKEKKTKEQVMKQLNNELNNLKQQQIKEQQLTLTKDADILRLEKEKKDKEKRVDKLEGDRKDRDKEIEKLKADQKEKKIKIDKLEEEKNALLADISKKEDEKKKLNEQIFAEQIKAKKLLEEEKEKEKKPVVPIDIISPDNYPIILLNTPLSRILNAAAHYNDPTRILAHRGLDLLMKWITEQALEEQKRDLGNTGIIEEISQIVIKERMDRYQELKDNQRMIQSFRCLIELVKSDESIRRSIECCLFKDLIKMIKENSVNSNNKSNKQLSTPNVSRTGSPSSIPQDQLINSIQITSPKTNSSLNSTQNKSFIQITHLHTFLLYSFTPTTNEQKDKLFQMGIVASFVALLAHPDKKVVTDAIDGLYNIIVGGSNLSRDSMFHPYFRTVIQGEGDGKIDVNNPNINYQDDYEDEDQEACDNFTINPCSGVGRLMDVFEQSKFVDHQLTIAMSIGFLFRGRKLPQRCQRCIKVLKERMLQSDDTIAKSAISALKFLSPRKENHKLIVDRPFVQQLVSVIQNRQELVAENAMNVLFELYTKGDESVQEIIASYTPLSKLQPHMHNQDKYIRGCAKALFRQLKKHPINMQSTEEESEEDEDDEGKGKN